MTLNPFIRVELIVHMANIPMLQEIKVRREDLGIAQKQLAKLCDIKPSLLNMVEKGNAKLSYGNLVTIFKVLDKKAEESLKNVKIAGKICVKNLFYVKKNDYLKDVINTMKIKCLYSDRILVQYLSY